MPPGPSSSSRFETLLSSSSTRMERPVNSARSFVVGDVYVRFVAPLDWCFEAFRQQTSEGAATVEHSRIRGSAEPPHDRDSSGGFLAMASRAPSNRSDTGAFASQ